MRDGSPLIRTRSMSLAVMTSPRWIVTRAARTSSVWVVELHVHTASSAPTQIAATPPATSAGRRRNLGGGVNAVLPTEADGARGSVTRSPGADVVVMLVPLRPDARQFTSTCASPMVIWVERV